MNSNLNEQQKTRTEVKEKNKVRREKLAGYFFNLSQLTFAGLVLGGISLFSEITQPISWWSVVVGGYATYIFAFFANKILKN